MLYNLYLKNEWKYNTRKRINKAINNAKKNQHPLHKLRCQLVCKYVQAKLIHVIKNNNEINPPIKNAHPINWYPRKYLNCKNQLGNWVGLALVKANFVCLFLIYFLIS